MQHLQIHKKIHSTTLNQIVTSHLDTSRYRNFWKNWSLNKSLSLGNFGLNKVLVSKILVLEKKYQSINFGLKKCLKIRLKILVLKKILVSVYLKILVSSLSDPNGTLINWIWQNEVSINWPLGQPTKICQTGSQILSMKYIFSPDGRSFGKKIRIQSATSGNISQKWSFSWNLHWVLWMVENYS